MDEHSESGSTEDSGYTGEEDPALQQYETKISSPTSATPSTVLKNGTADLGKELQNRCCCACELKMVHFLWLVVVVVWGLLSLPIIFYHIPPVSHCLLACSHALTRAEGCGVCAYNDSFQYCCGRV
jgi:hypothetical protein